MVAAKIYHRPTPQRLSKHGVVDDPYDGRIRGYASAAWLRVIFIAAATRTLKTRAERP
jgi:hypothetical protein